MPLRILALGDAHFQTSNIIEVDIFLAKLAIWLEQHKDDIDIIVNMGDTTHDHSKLHVSPLNKAIEYTRLISSYKPTYLLVGNHDATNNTIFLTSQHWLNCLKGWTNVTVVDDVIVETIKGEKIVFCPYVTDGRFIEALNTREGEWEDAKCILSHVTIRGAQMGSMIAKDADEWPPEFPMLVSGHIHLSHWLGPNMYYTGSILQVAVNESPDKHIALIDVGEKVTVQEINLHLPKKIIVYVDVGELNENYIVPNEPDTKYSLYISGNVDEFKAFRKSTIFGELSRLPQILGGTKGLKFKQKKLEVKQVTAKLESIKGAKMKHFSDLLLNAIRDEEDELLFSLYRHLVHEDEEDLSELVADTFIISSIIRTD